MASNFVLTLDTTAPGGVSITLAGGAGFTGTRDITAAIATSDTPTTGYTMKIYGDVDDSFAPTEYRAVEANAPWIAYSTSKSVRLATGDGAKTVRLKVRDEVWNESAEQTDGITLDTTIPVITITGPDVPKVSKISGKRVASFSFQSDTDLQAYKVKVVPATNSLEGAGTTILTTNGSTNMTGGATGATTPVNSTIDGRDLEVASSGDGDKIIKVFGQETGSGSWSV